METQSYEMTQGNQEAPEHVRAERRLTPPVDVYENADEILVLVDVPGVEHKGLDIRLEGGKLDVEARQLDTAPEVEPVVFARSFSVPNSVDAARVAAELDMGVLKVHLPKSEAAKPRQIQVKVG